MWLVDCGAILTGVDSTWSVVERGISLVPKSYKSEFDGSD